MLGENIKQARIAKNMTQEELALRVGVVRQTVSKWEKALSVPDANMLLQISNLLEVPVDTLLGVEHTDTEVDALTAELERTKELLAAYEAQSRRTALAGQKRGLILMLSFLALVAMLTFRNQIVSIVLMSACVLSALIVLYRNLELLTNISRESQSRALKAATIFDIVIVVLMLGISVLHRLTGIQLTAQSEGSFAIALFSCVILFSGLICPKLPFSRHTGLRLPWTVLDEDTWNLAHRVIGYTALPIAMLFIAGALTIDNVGAVAIATAILWIGIPGLISGIYFWRKMHGKL